MKIKETIRVISRNLIIAFIGLLGLGLITSCSPEDNLEDEVCTDFTIKTSDCLYNRDLVAQINWIYEGTYRGEKILEEYRMYVIRYDIKNFRRGQVVKAGVSRCANQFGRIDCSIENYNQRADHLVRARVRDIINFEDYMEVNYGREWN